MKIKNGNKILLIPQNGMGDNLMFLPLAYPISLLRNVEIHFLSNTRNGASDIVKHSPYINKIIEFDFPGSIYTVKEYIKFYIVKFVPLLFKIKREHYDYVLAINPNYLTRSVLFFFHKKKKIVSVNKTINQHLHGLSLLKNFENIVFQSECSNLLFFENEKEVLNKYSLNTKRYILVNLYGSIKAKSNNEHKLIPLLHKQFKNQLKIVAIGQNESHIKNVHITDLVNLLSIEEVAVVIKNALLFVTVDGGLMHLGIIQKIPMIAIFKVIHSKYLKPTDENYPFFKAYDEKNEDASFENLKRNINNNATIKKIDEMDILREVVNYV